MRYEIHLRNAPGDYKPRYPGLVNSGKVVDITRVSWWGLRREKIVNGVLSDEINNELEIIRDYFKHNKVKVKFSSSAISQESHLLGKIINITRKD